VLLGLTDDQEFFRQTTARFLDEHVPVAELRRLRDHPAGFEEKYWRAGADLGWTSLLVDDAHGGGTTSGDGLADLAVIAYEFGRHAAPGPLIATNVVAHALSAAGGHPLLADILAGNAIVAWAPHVGGTISGDGVARQVESAAVATHVLAGNAVVPMSEVHTEPMGTVDLTRRFDVVRFDNAPSADVVTLDTERLVQMATALACVESVGAMQTAFDLTVAWAFDRYSFGRPLASYQALKHRFADMKVWLEASHAISADAVAALSASAPNAPELVSAAKAYTGHYGSELMHECIQMHGGIGVTFEHDLHLYLRRHTVNRALYGTPSEHRQKLAALQ
jgi:alkylation response protein AidB-like acyl-CoA dehydrogenase